MSFTFSLSDPQLNPLQLSAIANPSRRPAEPQIRPKASYPTLSPMSSRLFHRRDKLGRDQRNDLNGTTDHLIDQRQKKHVEDAFISSQLVELGLLDPRHAIGKRGAQEESGYKKRYERLHVVNATIFPSNHARQIFETASNGKTCGRDRQLAFDCGPSGVCQFSGAAGAKQPDVFCSPVSAPVNAPVTASLAVAQVTPPLSPARASSTLSTSPRPLRLTVAHISLRPREHLAVASHCYQPHQMRRAWANLAHHSDSSTSHHNTSSRHDAAPPYSSHSYDQRPESDSTANKSSKSTKSSGKSHRSKTSINSLKSRAGTGQSGMLDSQRRDNRRERTFVGTECAVCEEPLEHTLRGERILQFSCGHVSHGACFYEYLKMGGEPERHQGEGGHCPSCERPLGLDTSRGGNVLDIEKITDIVRSASLKDPIPQTHHNQNSQNSREKWGDNASHATTRPSHDKDDEEYSRERGQQQSRLGHHNGRESAAGQYRDDRRDTRETRDTRHTNYTSDARDARGMGRDSHQTQQTQHTHNMSQYTQQSHNSESQDQYRPLPSMDRYGATNHKRNESEATGHHTTATTSSNGYTETNLSGHQGLRNTYDSQVPEADILSPRSSMVKNPIPPPVVTVRAEFPTLERSRAQQTLTCLVTIEVPDIGWRADPIDLHLPSGEAHSLSPTSHERPPSLAKTLPPAAASEPQAPRFIPYESPEVLEAMTESLRSRVENWHGLDFSRFGKLRLYGTIRVGKDKLQWQELECYLFAEMLICVKEKKGSSYDGRMKCTLKGSILIKKHLEGVTQTSAREEIGLTQRITSSNLRAGEENILTLSLSVKELPRFHLQFEGLNQLKLWQQALLDLHAVEQSPPRPMNGGYDTDREEMEEDDGDWRRSNDQPSSYKKRTSSLNSSAYAGRSQITANTDYSQRSAQQQVERALHVPVDIVVVVPASSSMAGVKMSLVRDALNYLVNALGPQDRMGLVTFGSPNGGIPLVGMTTKSWSGWGDILRSMRPASQKVHRADVIEGANVAMDLLMQRKTSNPIATILLISDASTAENESVDFVVSRAEAAKIAIHSFGLGLTHSPTPLLDLSSRTKGAYTYLKDWMMLRECLAGCLGALQSMSHQNTKLKLKLPEGSLAKFGKISGATSVVKRASGRDVEATIGDLVWGGRRDILVQLIIPADAATPALPSNPESDPWDSIMSSLDALAGPLDEGNSPRPVSVEEVPLLQADVSWGDLLREGAVTHLPRPTLLAITMLPPSSSSKGENLSGRKGSVFQDTGPKIPPHPSVVQRRMELLTSDMLSRALTLVGRGQQERAAHLLIETRAILKGLGRGGLPSVAGAGQPPPVPAMPLGGLPPLPPTPATPGFKGRSPSGNLGSLDGESSSSSMERDRTRRSRDPSPAQLSPATYQGGGFDARTAPLPPPPGPPPSLPLPSGGGGLSVDTRPQTSHVPYPGGLVIDPKTVEALDAELEAALEWIHHPAVFSRDSRKAVLQAVGVVQDQRAFTTRTGLEKLISDRVPGVLNALGRAADWGREQDDIESAGRGGLNGVREE